MPRLTPYLATYARCRTLGHAWDEIPVTRRDDRGPSIWLRCTHCATFRADVVDARTGDLIGRRYVHPDGYRDDEHHPRRDWRALYVGSMREAVDDLTRARRRRATG